MVNHAQTWKTIKAMVANIQDKDLRNFIMAELRKRAVKDWGFNPDSKYGVAKADTVELDDWEQDLVNDIQKASMYETDTRIEKRKKTDAEARSRMRSFVAKGGCLKDIPHEIRTPTIVNLYFDVMGEEIKNCIDLLEK